MFVLVGVWLFVQRGIFMRGRAELQFGQRDSSPQEEEELEELCMTTYGPRYNFQYWKSALQYNCDLTEIKYFDFFP